MQSGRSWVALAGACIGLGLLVMLTGQEQPDDDTLVVYCAHDSIYSEAILREFEKRTGIRLSIRFDTEATKSLGLVNLLEAEKDNPQCDVFWNNEILGVMRLKQQDVFEPYRGAGFDRIPKQFRDPDGYWTGFAARLRVWIVNTDHMKAEPEQVAHRFAADDLSRLSVAKPLYGTTRSHYSLLWSEWGGSRLQEWHAESRERGLVEVNGNALVSRLVAEGKCDLGWTDTDDFFQVADAGYSVAMLPYRNDAGETICIPNTVAIVRGTKRRSAAEKLVDFLLSEEVELMLAKSGSRQIPIGKTSEEQQAQWPGDVRQLAELAREGVDLNRIAGARQPCLDWLMREYTE